MRAPNVLSISPGLPFLETFVAGLIAGEVVRDFEPGDDPLALTDTTIYVPTRRAAVALHEVFLARAGTASILPPRILPLGALEATETELFLAEPDPVAAGLPLPPAASPIWRRLRLAHLIQRWARAVGGALRYVDADGRQEVDRREKFSVASSTVDAFALAGDLASLIDEMLIEDVEWRALDDLRMASFDQYWRITSTFLSIAIDLWPKVLAEAGLVDPARRQIALVAAQAAALAEGRAAGPVLAIGSTGTNKATARLLAAIARAPRGAVVLPGLDLDLDEPSWALVSGKIGAGQEPSHGHPQAAMARLLPILEITRADVRALGAPEPKHAERVRLVAEALRPADTTDQWRGYRRKVAQKIIAAALEGVSLIEAADEREEALCLAIAMREILETPGRTGALVTPDRELARRVRGELARWDIEVVDTGGEPLAARPLGALARLVAAAGASDLAARDATALLAHPLAAFGRARTEVARLATLLEIGVLRAVALDDKTVDEIFSAAQALAKDRHAHPAQRAISTSDWRAMEALWEEARAALAPLREIADAQPLDRWAAAHRETIANVAAEADTDEADALETLFDELLKDHPPLDLDAESYGIFFGRLATEATLRAGERPHPRLAIYGLLEARLIAADVMLLGGLDETIWPPQAKTDAFLNRPMRAELGLTSPERRIGQTAHDFAQEMGTQTIILSRARKRAGAPTVASRFLLRLEALSGRPWDMVRARGRDIVALAYALDRSPTAPVAAKRPRPTPPVALRPTGLSVTQIETLRRDPYSVYASRILELAPLPRIGSEIDASEFGSLMHGALHTFARAKAAAGTVDERHDSLEAILREAFAAALRDPTFQTFRWAVIEKAMEVFLSFDSQQRETTREISTETTGKLEITLADLTSFRLSARADRLDHHRDGTATLIDYKTGQPPSNKEVRVGFAPQLTLEAGILRHGGFGTPHLGEMRATYLKLGGKDGGRVQVIKFDNEPFDDVVARHLDGARQLLSSFRLVDTGYPSRPFPKYAKDYGNYDHLARVREWSFAAEDET